MYNSIYSICISYYLLDYNTHINQYILSIYYILYDVVLIIPSILPTRPISRSEYSEIRNHSEETNHPLSHDNFSIVGLARDASSHTIL